MYHRLVDWVSRLIREYTCRETGHHLLNSHLIASLQNVIIHSHVLTLQERNIEVS